MDSDDDFTLDDLLFGAWLDARDAGADDRTLADLASKHDAIATARNRALSATN
jgi:hypothetical protein